MSAIDEPARINEYSPQAIQTKLFTLDLGFENLKTYARIQDKRIEDLQGQIRGLEALMLDLQGQIRRLEQHA